VAQPSYGLTPLLRSFQRTRETLTRDGGGRYVDLGVEVRVVRQDVAGGREFLAGKPPLKPLSVLRFGGRWDTIERRFVGDSAAPVVWYVGERQAAFLRDVWENPLSGHRSLLVSAEGGGKTVLMSQAGWVFVLACARLGIFGGVLATAPTHARLDTFVRTMCDQTIVDSPHDTREGAFGTFYTATKDLRTVTGHVVMFRATKKASAATGSPIQGQTALGSLDDELQDTVENGADPDIEARLRGARNSRRICTATAKDSPSWRTFRDSKIATADWKIERIRFDENPFVWPEHWDRMKRNVSAREWQRRGLAMDVGPENAVYHSWERSENARALPDIGRPKDITAKVLNGYHALIGHDPGALKDVSLVLKCYEVERRRVWWVVDELTTRETTSEDHAATLREHLQQNWQLQWPGHDEPKVLVRCDPYGDSDSKTDRSVYTTFKLAGFHILSAAYNKHGEGRGRVPKDAGIEMVNRLFCSATGERRLFVDPACKDLVNAIETCRRDEAGKAEIFRKGTESDVSHYVASLRYALWPYERLRDVPPATPREGLV
jgi:hypothetical protein